MMDNRGGRSPGRAVLAVLAALMLVALAAGDATAAKKRGGPKTPPPANAATTDFSDAAVKAAIDKAAEYLWKLQLPDGSWAAFGEYKDGPTALIAYALMESGVKPFDKRMTKALKWLEEIRNTKGYVGKTYCLGLRCQTWLSAIRMKATDYRAALKRDAKQLVLSTSNGSYGYNSTGAPAAGDHSNSQYGVLGVWAAAMANLEVPVAYWLKVMKHWMSVQCADGGWVYNGGGAAGTGPMSAAGVATLFVCFDNLFNEAFAGCNPGRDGRNAQVPIQRGLDWFDKKFAGTVGAVDGYYLYGVERIGLASGYKYFGTTDWYKTGSQLLLRNQAADGSWNGGHGGAPVVTAQCMLFLIRGRRPVIFNKLKYDGDWDNRPRALAMLTRWMHDVFEHEVFWQIVSLKIPPSEWHDAPALLISGHKAPVFGKDDLDKLRTYVHQGGTIFSVTECNGTAFDQAMRESYSKLFPEYEIKEAPLTHELYRIQEDLTRTGLKFHVVSNGIRPLAIHINRDATRAWQTYQYSAEKWAFQAALNVYLYVTDRTLPARGSRTWPAPPTAAPEDTVKLARIKFNGNWDPEPLAYQRFSRLMLEKNKVKVEWSPVAIDELAAAGAKVAVLTGTGQLRLSDKDAHALRQFVEGGGTLVVDAAGGDKKFGESAWKALRVAFPAGTLANMKASDPLFSVDDQKIETFRYRKKTAVRMRSGDPALWASAGEGRVIFSYEDITAALVGFPSFTCDGYDPETAYAIMRNVVLSKLPKEQAESQPATAAAEGE